MISSATRAALLACVALVACRSGEGSTIADSAQAAPVAPVAAATSAASDSAPVNGFLSNDAFIAGLSHDLNLDDDVAVFRYVFQRLPARVVVFPSENYYYFRFPVKAGVVWGSLSLSAEDRDDGILGFGYSIHNEDPSAPESLRRPGGGKSLGRADGVVVQRLGDLRYVVTFENRRVVFELHDVGMEPPRRARLTGDEVMVSPLLDESGLGFHLLFNRAVSRLYLVLNEDRPTAETFRQIGAGVVVGERTGFVFFDDTAQSQRILIGVRGENVLKNNWYDGPFDQMPDNNIRAGRIPGYQRYLEANYPETKGRIDRYGRYKKRDGTRIAVAPYLVYFNESEMLTRTAACGRESRTRSAFVDCLTRQEFRVPDDRRHLVY